MTTKTTKKRGGTCDHRDMINYYIESEGMSTELALRMYHEVNLEDGKNLHAVACSKCATMIGFKKCTGCPKTSKLRYCSRECQLADWPSHKACCGGRFAVNKST